ncbi:unnamed protein product [Soboliphyme baturini]|uniref:PDZ domain-containing protein n=1 Tax=Soboliphyme baturini TaxID=241478 RepID=A0A183IYH7_9BILA|nr:unnamed protein product [Soboliphyme baturini]
MNMSQLSARNSLLYSIELLMKLCYNLDSENLQTLALQLSVRCRNLQNDLKRVSSANAHPRPALCCGQLPDRVHLLLEISCLAEDTKRIISWLDRNPFNITSYYRTFRNSVLHVVVQIIQLTQNGSKDILENLKNIQMLVKLCAICDRLVEETKDPLVIQTAYLRKVYLRKLRSNDEWGINLESPYRGVHFISSIRFQSPADLCGKVNIGDEIVEIDDQVVIGWQRKCLLSLLKSKEHHACLVLKKHPENTCSVAKSFTGKPKFLTADITRAKCRKERRRSASVMLIPVSFECCGQNVEFPKEG